MNVMMEHRLKQLQCADSDVSAEKERAKQVSGSGHSLLYGAPSKPLLSSLPQFDQVLCSRQSSVKEKLQSRMKQRRKDRHPDAATPTVEEQATADDSRVQVALLQVNCLTLSFLFKISQ